MTLKKLILFITFTLFLACSHPQPGSDKTIAGAVLGAGWGAGAGAVVGNQLQYARTGEGAAIGAGFGLVSGAMTGYSYDQIENTQIRHEKELEALRVHNMANAQQLRNLHDQLDTGSAASIAGGVYQVFFDVDATNLRSGAIANLEVIAESLKGNSGNYTINVVGHSDNAGGKDYNERLAAARASSVSAYLAARGIVINSIKVESHGANRPIASNNTEAGRQLNRRVDVYISAG